MPEHYGRHPSLYTETEQRRFIQEAARLPLRKLRQNQAIVKVQIKAVYGPPDKLRVLEDLQALLRLYSGAVGVRVFGDNGEEFVCPRKR